MKANKELFDQWKLLSYTVRNLAGIIQNDAELTGMQIFEWEKLVLKAKLNLDNLINATKKYIIDNNKEECKNKEEHFKRIEFKEID